MPTVTQSIGSAGRNYSTLAGWAAGLPANLVTDGNSYVGQCYADSEFTGTVRLLNLTGHTTDASHTITLTTGPGQSFRDNPNVQTNHLRYDSSYGVAITSTVTDSNAVITAADTNVFISNLQVKLVGNATSAFIFNSTNGAVVSNCIFAADTSTNYGVRLIGGSIKNCLIYRSVGLGLALNGAANAYFCTIVNVTDSTPTSAALTVIDGGTVVNNCAVFGFVIFSTDTTGTYTTCMTDGSAGLPGGVTGSLTYASQFQNTTAAAGDWRLKTGANLRGAGTADAINGATDISGTARPQAGLWDIGAWEDPPGNIFLMGARVM